MRWLAVLLLASAPAHADGLLYAAGDIASSGSGKELTAQILDAHPAGIVLTLGDNAYSDGTAAEFAARYEPTWGRHKARTYPSPGNHDWRTACASAYRDYFAAAGRPTGAPCDLWYSYDFDGWHFVALNSNVDTDYGSAQAAWLEADLSASDADCTLAYWHHPRFSSGDSHGSSTATQDVWKILHSHGADLVLAGHDHNYERFAPLDAFGNADATAPRSFVVGTGGSSLRPMGVIEPGSEASAGNLYGVLELTLRATGYDWRFLPAAGYAYADAGSASCVGLHAPPWMGDAGCGIGPELALLLPLLYSIRVRRHPRSVKPDARPRA